MKIVNLLMCGLLCLSMRGADVGSSAKSSEIKKRIDPVEGWEKWTQGQENSNLKEFQDIEWLGDNGLKDVLEIFQSTFKSLVDDFNKLSKPEFKSENELSEFKKSYQLILKKYDEAKTGFDLFSQYFSYEGSPVKKNPLFRSAHKLEEELVSIIKIKQRFIDSQTSWFNYKRQSGSKESPPKLKEEAKKLKGEWQEPIEDLAKQVEGLKKLVVTGNDNPLLLQEKKSRYGEQYNKLLLAYRQFYKSIKQDKKYEEYSSILSIIKNSLDSINAILNNKKADMQALTPLMVLEKNAKELLEKLKTVNAEGVLDTLQISYVDLKAEYDSSDKSKDKELTASLARDLQEIKKIIVKENIDFITQEVETVLKNAQALWDAREIGVKLVKKRLLELKKAADAINYKVASFMGTSQSNFDSSKNDPINKKIEYFRLKVEMIYDIIKKIERIVYPQSDISSQIEGFMSTGSGVIGGGVNAQVIKDMKLKYDTYFGKLGTLEVSMTSEEKRNVLTTVELLKQQIEKYEADALQKEISSLESSIKSASLQNISQIQDQYNKIVARYNENKKYFSHDVLQRLVIQMDVLKKDIQNVRTRLELAKSRAYGFKGLLYGAGALLAGYYTFRGSSETSSYKTGALGTLTSILGFSAFSNLSKWFFPSKKPAEKKSLDFGAQR